MEADDFQLWEIRPFNTTGIFIYRDQKKVLCTVDHKKKLLWSSFFKWCVCTCLCAQINLTGGFCLPDDLVASKRTQNYLSWVKSVFNDVVQTEPTTCQTSKPRENFNIKSTLLVLNTRLWDIIEVQII